MSTLTYPGVYIEEISSGQNTITPVATSIGAFVGWAPKGPVASPTLVESWLDYVAQFGGLDARSLLGYSVSQFFANGGSSCYIVRIVWDGTLPAASGAPIPCATAFADNIGYPSATFTATIGGLSGSLTLGIGTPVLTAITIAPSLPAGYTQPLTIPPMPVNATMNLVATPTYSDNGSAPPLTAVGWTSSNINVVTVSTSGLVTAVGAGSAIVQATSGIVSGSLTLSVVNAVFSGLTITYPNEPATPPASVNLPVGETLALSATLSMSGATQDVTTGVGWTPAANFVSTQSPGLFTGAATGNVGVTALLPWQPASGTPNATLTIDVGAAALLSAALYPANTVLTVTQSCDYLVFGIESSPPNAAPAQLPAADWPVVSSDSTIASVASPNAVTARKAGVVTLTATGPGGTTITTPLTVTAATLAGITIAPATVSVPVEGTQQLTATGLYSDGSSANLTTSVGWAAPGGVVAVPASGLLTGTAQGTATVTAQWQGVNSLAPNISVTVTAPALQSITVAAVPPTTTALTVGQPLTLQATGHYSDGTTQDVTAAATWSTSAPTTTTIAGGKALASSAGAPLTLFAQNPGAWGNAIEVTVSLQPPPNSDRFNLLVQQLATNGQLVTLESFVNLSITQGDPRYAVTVVDNDSNYVTFVNPATNASVTLTAPPAACGPVPLTGGADGTALVPASDQNFEVMLTTNPAGGVYELASVPIFNLLCVPGETDAPTISLLQKFCHDMRAVFLVDAPQLVKTSDLTAQGPIGTTVSGSFAGGLGGTYASNSAYYYPWVYAPDPLAGNRPALFPPCGFVAGICAATDATRGVWKAPAGIGAGLTGNAGLQTVLTDADNGNLNPQAINCLRQFRVYGDVVWGSRTLAGSDQAGSEYKYLPIRRLALFLESSLYEGTQWVVFEPNDEKLWGQIRLNVNSFMQLLFLQGAFAGTTPQQAYFVKCDGDNNPDSSVALGIVNIAVGFAPLYPAEFVVIQVQQITAQAPSS